jgi:hypothetical protein
MTKRMAAKQIVRFMACAYLLAASYSSRAQTGTQFWAEWQVSYPFANRYLVENTFAYQTLLSKGEAWTSLSISPVFEYTLLPAVELISEIPIGRTRQTDNVTTFEISPMIGARFHVTQNRRFNTRILTRFQSRNFQDVATGVWEFKGRFRLRGELTVSINGPNLFVDKLWYAFADYEEFLVVDEQVNERYANLRRARIGVGYRLSYKHRFELGFTWQKSRDEINGTFESIDNVLQLKYKMYLNPPKQLTTGN